MKILILGVTGMLGNAVYKNLSKDSNHEVWGTLRNGSKLQFFKKIEQKFLIDDTNVLDDDLLLKLMNRIRPDIVINCTGLIKQLSAVKDPRIALPINAIFPHRLAEICHLMGSRMIQLSSDCVYSGRIGNYQESQASDAEDLYGKSKYIGEIHDQSHVITLRTSGIGHELSTRNGLLEWFLSQSGQVQGYTKAIYSGLTSCELARVIKDFVLPDPGLSGLYHISSKAISKFDLLKLIAKVYCKDIKIVPDSSSLVIDRSLNSERFTKATGYVSPDWPDLISEMYHSR